MGGVIGLPAAAILLINNHRDRATDQIAGRRTFAILIGPQLSRWAYVVLLALSVLGAFAFAPCATLLVPVALFGGLLSMMMLTSPVSPRLNRLIPATALFQVLLLLELVAGRGLCG